MTAQFGFCIAIGFFAIIAQTNGSMCYDITSYQSSHKIDYQDFFDRTSSTEFHETQETHASKKVTETCCSGYANDPEVCPCKYGWSGEFCEKSLLCYIAPETSEVRPVTNIEDVTANPKEKWKGFLKECHPDCRNKIKYASPIIRKIATTNYHLIPNNLSCNTITAVNQSTIGKKYITGTVTVLIIILLVMVLGTVYTVCRKRRPRYRTRDESSELKYDDVGLGPKLPTYDDVVPQIHIYDYVDVQPISAYDDVNVGENYVYDEVYGHLRIRG